MGNAQFFACTVIITWKLWQEEGESRIKIVWLLHETTMMITSYIVTMDNFVDYLPIGLINLALTDSDKWNDTTHANSHIVDISPKCTESYFSKDGCSSFLIKCCLKNSWGWANAKLMPLFHDFLRKVPKKAVICYSKNYVDM